MTATAAATTRSSQSARLTAWQHRLRPWWPVLRYCGGVYVAVRAGLFVLGLAVWSLTGDGALPGSAPRGAAAHWTYAFKGWIRLDASWYLRLARDGYSVQGRNASFYPGYPLLIRVFSYVFLGNYEVAALFVSNLALLAALLVLYRLTEREYDLATARRAVLYLCLFPTALFLFDAFSESLYLLAAVGAFALARRGHWVWAALAGLGAGLTRSTGVVVALALAAEAIHQAVEGRRAGRQASRLRRAGVTAGRLACSVVPLAGPAAYLLYWQLRFHDWQAPLRLEKVIWNRHFSLPWQTLGNAFDLAGVHGLVAGQGWLDLDLVLVAAGLALGIWVAFRARPVYTVYTWASIVFFLCSTVPSRPLASDPRYLVTLFPLIWPLARLGRRPGLHETIAVASGASLAILSYLFLTTQRLF